MSRSRRIVRFSSVAPLSLLAALCGVACSSSPGEETASSQSQDLVVIGPRPTIPLGMWGTLQGTGGNCLDVYAANPTSTIVDNGACNGTNAQKFFFNLNGTIQNDWGYCLDVLGDDTSAGKLDFTTCNGTAAQSWTLHGSQVMGPAGKCLDVYADNTTPGTTVDLATCNGTPAQNWQIIDVATRLRSVGTKCLDIIDSSTAQDAPLQIFECNGGPNAQIFTFSAAGEIKNAAGECLDVYAGNAQYGHVEMSTCNGTASQKWTRQGRALRSSVSSSSLTGMCLGTVIDFLGITSAVESSLDHTSVGLAACDGTEDQMWIPADLFPSGQTQLLVITSSALSPSFSNFLSYKDSIGVPTQVLTVDTIRSRYPAADDAASVKLAIKDYYENEGTEYVLLGGDASQVPTRYRTVTDVNANNQAFIFSDLYYSNLYTGHMAGNGFHGGFDTWDSNGNGLYDEEGWDNPTVNPDNVSGFPDVAVTRIPASDATTMQGTLAKIIAYEKLLPQHGGSGMPFNGKYGFVADADYAGAGEAYGLVGNIASQLSVAVDGYAEEIGQTASDGNPGPAPTTSGWTNDNSSWSAFQAAMQASSFEYMTYVGHGGPGVWGFNGTYSGQASQLTNAYFPVVAASACQTGSMTPQVGGSSVPIGTYPVPYPVYGASSAGNIGSMWLTNTSGGAIAYMGENVVLEDQPGVDFIAGFYNLKKNNGYTRLGDLFRVRSQQYFNQEYDGVTGGYDVEFAQPRLYLGIMNLFGDPSMQVL